MAVDVRTGKDRMLLENASIGELAFNPTDRSLIGVRHQYGRATLVRIPPYTDWKEIHTFMEVVPSDLDVSDGTLSATMTDDRGNQHARVWKLDRRPGDTVPLSEFAFDKPFPKACVFARRALFYGSSYYTGTNISL
jgi:hypothetical protein